MITDYDNIQNNFLIHKLVYIYINNNDDNNNILFVMYIYLIKFYIPN